ncbi:MAG TPA: L,D-transpeptidase family protein [Pyrinomonadaceae bacterium]|nr:L,D-transpeptidase family protein [Pyrinomonadaceae bacterium]
MKILFLAILVATLSVPLVAQIKKPEPPAVKAPFSESRQAVVVTTKDWNATTGEAQLYERTTQRANWKSKGEKFPVVIGRGGLGWAKDSAPEKATQFKAEGDGRSPAGMFPLTFAFGSSMKPEQITFPYTRLGRYTECVDDVNSHHYNKIVGRDQVGIFDWKSSEKMLEIGEPYALGVFVAYNSYPVVKGNGSCIFLHVWKDAATPTAGCTAMNRPDLEKIVSWLEPDHNPYLVILPEAEYKDLRKSWNLPKLK